jgi:putative DNA primase/helicase
MNIRSRAEKGRLIDRQPVRGSVRFIRPFKTASQYSEVLVQAIRLNKIAPIDVPWLWPDRIPLGRITLLVSDPGVAKSLLTLDIAARVSAGLPWPDEPKPEIAPPACSAISRSRAGLPPSSVLLLTAEDDLADTIRPRLEALGGDCSRTFAQCSSLALRDESDDGAIHRPFALNRDLARLDNLLDAIPDCRLIVIDPISACLGGANEHANAEIQNLLAPLAALARRRNLAVLAVSHLRKKNGAAIHRTMGSLAFLAAARAAWLLAKDPDEANRRLFLPLKNNLAPHVAGLAYTVEIRDGMPLLHWSTEHVQFAAETIFTIARPPGRPNDERQHAIGWLRQLLADGPRPTRDIKEEADAHGISPGTLRRAFREVDGQACRQGPFPFGQWMWKLPGVDAQNTEADFCASTDFLAEFAALFARRSPPQASREPAAEESPQHR